MDVRVKGIVENLLTTRRRVEYRSISKRQNEKAYRPRRWWQIMSAMLIVSGFSPAAHAEELVNNLHFPGHYYDEESGLHYNWNRYYNPKTGRYISSDPIGLGAGTNLYAYSLNNPANYIDPLGLYVPKFLPENCVMIIVDDESKNYIDKITGDPYVYEKDIIFSGIPIRRRKGDTLIIGFIARLFWEQVTLNFRFAITDIEYYVECEEKDNCGNVSISRDYSSHYEKSEKRLKDTIKRWDEIIFSDADIPIVRRR